MKHDVLSFSTFHCFVDRHFLAKNAQLLFFFLLNVDLKGVDSLVELLSTIRLFRKDLIVKRCSQVASSKDQRNVHVLFRKTLCL